MRAAIKKLLINDFGSEKLMTKKKKIPKELKNLKTSKYLCHIQLCLVVSKE